MRFERLAEFEFEDAIKRSGGLCVMVLGCIEKHGQHLPVGTDSLKGDKIAEIATDIADVCLFPTTMWLGNVSGTHQITNTNGLHGFIGISPMTLVTVLEELCDEIARNGFNKILLLNSHGGNKATLDFFMSQQAYKNKQYATMWTGAYDFANLQAGDVLAAAKADPEGFSMLTEEDYRTLEKFAETGMGGGHGDFRETALVYGTYPELVKPEMFDAESGLSNDMAKHLTDAGLAPYPFWDKEHPNSFDGFAPIGCTKTIGDAMLKMSVDRLVGILNLVKNDDVCVEMVKSGMFLSDANRK